MAPPMDHAYACTEPKPTKRPKSSHCSAINCNNSRQHTPQFSFFRFPKEKERCMRWVVNTRRQDLLERIKKNPNESVKLHVSNVLCAQHFEQSQFQNSLQNKLVKTAVPTIFDVPNPPATVTPKRAPPSKRVCAESSLSKETPSLDLALPRSPSSSTDQPSTSSSIDQSSASSSVTHSSTDPLPTSASLFMSPGSSSSTTTSSRASSLTPRKMAMKRKIKALRKKIQRRDSEIKTFTCTDNHPQETLRETLSKFLSGTALEFVMSQIAVSKRSPSGCRWSVHAKKLGISLFHSSPKTYRMLRKVFHLPSVTTLKRSLQNFNIETGFNTQLLQVFKQKVSKMSTSDTLCSLMFDEMSIKEFISYNAKLDRVQGFEDFGTFRSKFVANHATVFMARGIFGNWKQPVAYFFSSGPIKHKMLSSLIKDALDCLEDMRLQVKSLICDQRSNNRSALKSLGVSVQTPYINLTSASGKQQTIHVIFDPPHLLKNIRNNLKKHGYTVKGKQVLWSHVKMFYDQDQKLPVRMAPKLTKKHIELPPFSSLRVCYAAQVLSHSVYAGISTMIAFNTLPQEAQPTANFVKQMDNLFNCFNVKKPKSKRPFNHAMTNSSTHRQFLLDSLSWIDTIESNSKTKRPPCLEGWTISIKSLLSLFDELAHNHGIKYLLSARLNQDCLENLFSTIRYKGGNRFNPSVCEFKEALHQTMVDLLFVTSATKNCEDDLDKFLVNITSAQSQQPERKTRESSVNLHTELVNFDMVPELVLQEQNVVAYIAGYVAKKIKNKICEQCRLTICEVSGNSQSETESLTFLSNKLYSTSCKTGLEVPSQELIDMCLAVEEHYKSVGGNLFHVDKVRQHLFSQLSGKVGRIACSNSCATSDKIVNLYLNVRLHHSVKLTNQQFQQSGLKRIRKIVTLSHA